MLITLLQPHTMFADMDRLPFLHWKLFCLCYLLSPNTGFLLLGHLLPSLEQTFASSRDCVAGTIALRIDSSFSCPRSEITLLSAQECHLFK